MNTSYVLQLRKCKCGNTPVLHSSRTDDIRVRQLRCACGEKGAALMFTKPEHEAQILQAAIDGWNLGE